MLGQGNNGVIESDQQNRRQEKEQPSLLYNITVLALQRECGQRNRVEFHP